MLFLRRVHSHKKLGECSDEQCSYQNVVKKSENFLIPLSYTGKYFSVLRVHGKYFPNQLSAKCMQAINLIFHRKSMIN